MAIQMRKGSKDDFDPTKMLPGEWAVSIDSDTNNQIVWMCFAAGVVKRMGTYEDFRAQIAEATGEIKEEYLAEFQVILDQIEELAQQTSENTDTVVTIRDDFLNSYLPQIQDCLSKSKNYASNASASASAAKASETASMKSENASRISESNAVGAAQTATDKDDAAATSAVNAAESATVAATAKDAAVKAGDDAKALVDEAMEMLESGSLVGPPGIQGPQGERGEKGEQGLQGAMGPTGATGPQGEQGIQGAAGADGEKGEKGEKGDQGDKGESGITTPVNGFFTLSVDADGNLWAYSAEDGTTPDFEYDSATGNLYVVQEVS